MKYWVYLDGEVPGSYEADELAATPGFSETAMVCPAEGGIESRNWQHAGQFPDIIDALGRRTPTPPSPPVQPPRPAAGSGAPEGTPRGPNDVLDDSSERIFRHVSELMEELENRRSERALTQSLQRQVVELKNELLAMRERNQYLQDRADLIEGFQEREKKIQETLGAARSDVRERDRRIRESDKEVERLKKELNSSERGAANLSGDLKHQSLVCEELSGQLAQKEFTLARAFAVIRRLEKVLGEMLPGSTDGISRELPGYEAAAPAEPDREEPPPEPPAQPEQRPEAPEPAGPEIKVRRVADADEPAEQAPEPAEPAPEPAEPAQRTPEPEKAAEKPPAQPQPEAGPPQPEAGPPQPEAGPPQPEAGQPEPEKQPPVPEEITPLPPPWQTALKRFTSMIKRRFPVWGAPPKQEPDKTDPQN